MAYKIKQGKVKRRDILEIKAEMKKRGIRKDLYSDGDFAYGIYGIMFALEDAQERKK